MNFVPSCEQPPALVLYFLHDATQIAAADADEPIQLYARRPSQDNSRLAALSEHVHMRRTVIVGENHEPEAMGTVNGHHETNPSLLGFQELAHYRTV
jgi:hypothetical protein